MYKNQIIHFSGGIQDWVGELDQTPHKMGENWYRILNPCMIIKKKNAQGQLVEALVAIQGTGNFYKQYIDIRVPVESILEIRTVDKEGQLYKAYLKESAREPSQLIVPPNDDIIIPR